MENSDAPSLQITVALALSMLKTRRSGWFRYEGGVLIVLGVAALTLMAAGDSAANLAVGWILTLSGLLGLIGVYLTPDDVHPVWGILSDFIGVLAGLLLFAGGLHAGRYGGWVVTAYLVADGILLILFADDWRRRGRGRWAWVGASGGVDLLLAIAVAFSNAKLTPVFIAMAIGIDLCAAGAAFLAIGFRNDRRPQPP